MVPFNHLCRSEFSPLWTEQGSLCCLHFAVLFPHNFQLFDDLWQVLEPLYLNLMLHFVLMLVEMNFFCSFLYMLAAWWL